MAELTKTNTAGIILLSVVMSILGTQGIGLIDLGFDTNSIDSINFSNNVYFCVERPDFAYNCEGFSKYVSEEGKCINATNVATGEIEGNKICRSGWKLIEDDMTFEPIVNESVVFMDDVYYDGEIHTIMIMDDDGLSTATDGKKCLKKTKTFNAKDFLDISELGVDC